MISEPMTMATDYMIAALAAFYGLRLLKNQYSEEQLCRRSWGIGFMFVALGALLGGTSHGFANHLSLFGKGLIWKGTVYSIGLSTFFMLAGTIKGSLSELKWRKPFYIYNGLALAVYAIVMIFQNAFLFVILNYVPALILIMGLQIWALKNNQARSARWLISGVIISFVGAGVQQSGLGFHEHFNHNDIYHVIQMFGLYCFYKGVRELKDFGSSVLAPSSL